MSDIFTAISGVMSDIGAIGKDKKAEAGFGRSYKYRGIDDVYNALQPAMIKHGVFCTPEVLEQTREERTTSKGGLLIYSVCKVKYSFFCADGSSVSATVVGEGMDSGDKASNKAMSAAYKYACFQVFCIPTDEMIDSERDNPQPAPRDREMERRTEEARDSLIDEIKVKVVRDVMKQKGFTTKEKEREFFNKPVEKWTIQNFTTFMDWAEGKKKG